MTMTLTLTLQALATCFHTIFVADVPRMASARRDEARRFITLVDQLYNVKARLVAPSPSLALALALTLTH